MIGLILLLAIGMALLWLVGVGATAWMLTHPPRRTYGVAVARGRPGDPSELDRPREFQAWSVRSRGRSLPVWSIRGDLPDGGPVVILTHGWADSRIGALVRVGAIAPAASLIIAWDLPGHGEAPGRCGLGIPELADLRALVDAASREAGGAAPLVLYGWSLGAGLSIAAAGQDERIGAVIAESPYRLPGTPARNVLRARGLPWRATLGPALRAVGAGAGDARFRGFDRAAIAGTLECPLLVLHGELDLVSPLEDGRAIGSAAPKGSIAIIQGGGHNDLWTEPRFAGNATRAVQDFLRLALRPTLDA